MRRSLKTRRMRTELRASVTDTVSQVQDGEGLVAEQPAAPTLSRRGLFAIVRGASALITTVTLGETFGPRELAVLSARGQSYGNGPADFQVDRTARTAGITTTDTGPQYRLLIRGATELSLTKAQLHGGVVRRRGPTARPRAVSLVRPGRPLPDVPAPPRPP